MSQPLPIGHFFWLTKDENYDVENEMNNAAPDATSFEMSKHHENSIERFQIGGKGTGHLYVVKVGLACSHPRMPRAHQAGFSRRSLAGVGFFETVRHHGPGLELVANVGECVGTSGFERCHLHEDQAQDTLDRPVVEKTATS
ncbi:hypothetical protein TNCV_2788991 [Trichonephila clavipes]|uniref:Uncharacterized protein n=1 Tax=Trichonephila clavipes TaxID=2585209 RepID=A0A8X6VWH1_TRICX|nr:hypothetical protein TNCV_2788991 [Trichonephila clavipes]